MAMDLKSLGASAIRGGFPEVAASHDRRKALEQRGQDQELRQLIQLARMVSDEQRDKRAAETHRAAMEDRAKNDPMALAALTTKVIELQKLRTERLESDPKADVTMLDRTIDVLQRSASTPLDKVDEPVKVDAVTGADKPSMLQKTNDFVGPMPRNAINPTQQAQPMQSPQQPAQQLPGAFGGGQLNEFAGFGAGQPGAPPAMQRPDNKGMFAGNSFVPPRAPKTFGELGIGDAQTQQTFSELEKKVPGLREMFTNDPEAFQRIFAAIRHGSKKRDGSPFTIQDAIELIKQSQ